MMEHWRRLGGVFQLSSKTCFLFEVLHGVFTFNLKFIFAFYIEGDSRTDE